MKCGVRLRRVHRRAPVTAQPRLSFCSRLARPTVDFLGFLAGITFDHGPVTTDVTRRDMKTQRSPPLERHMVVVKIMPNEKGAPNGKLADAELHFTAGAMEG